MLLKALPKSKDQAYRKVVVAKSPGERSDVPWISAESVDRAQEVVIAKGMNDSQFQANPLVTLQHAYTMPPADKSLWRKHVKDGDLVGVKAKTQYPARPDPWPPDKVLALVQADLLNGKSIGFLPLKVHLVDEKESKNTAILKKFSSLPIGCFWFGLRHSAASGGATDRRLCTSVAANIFGKRKPLAKPTPRPLYFTYTHKTISVRGMR